MLQSGDLDPNSALSDNDLTFAQQFEYFSSLDYNNQDEASGPIDTYFLNIRSRYSAASVENRTRDDDTTYSFGALFNSSNPSSISVPETPLYSDEKLDEIKAALPPWNNSPLWLTSESSGDYTSKFIYQLPDSWSYKSMHINSSGAECFVATIHESQFRCVVHKTSAIDRKFHFLKITRRGVLPQYELYNYGYTWPNVIRADYQIQPTAEILTATVPAGSYASEWIGGETDMATNGYIDFSSVMPINLRVIPETEAIVPADTHSIDVPTTVDFDDDNIKSAEVCWNISLNGGGGTLSKTMEVATDDVPDVDTTLFTNTTVGTTYEVEAKITKLSIVNGTELVEVTLNEPLSMKTGQIVVGPGEIGNIQVEETPPPLGQELQSMPADGVSTRVLTAILKDDFGNPAPAGVQVFWRLEGDGRFLQYDSETDASGKAKATLLAGKITDLNQKVIIEADFKRIEYVIQNTALNLDIQITPRVLTGNESDDKLIYDLAVASAATPGVLVNWHSTRGTVMASGTVGTDGVAHAELTIWRNTSSNDDNAEAVVVTASTGGSSAMKALELGSELKITASSQNLNSMSPTEIIVHSQVSDNSLSEVVSAEVLKHEMASFTSNDIAASLGNLPGMPDPQTVADFSLKLSATIPNNNGNEHTIINAPGAYRIYWDTSNRASLDIHNNGVVQTLKLREPLVASTNLNLSELEFSLLGDVAVFRGLGSSASLKLEGIFDGYTSAHIPSASLPLVSSCLARWKIITGENVNFAGLTTDRKIQFTNGVADFGISLPVGSNANEVLLKIRKFQSIKTHSLRLFVTSPAKNEIIAGAAELISHIAFDNYSTVSIPTFAEKELARHVNQTVANGVTTVGQVDVKGIGNALPSMIQGNLEQQADQSKRYLEWAAKLNAIADEIDKMADHADTLTVTDEQGRDLFKINAARQVEGALSAAGDQAWNWLGKKLKPLATTIAQANDAAIAAAMESLKGTAIWQEAQEIAEWTGAIPLFNDLATLKDQLTEEGVVELIKALHRASKAIGQNPQLAAVKLMTQMEDFIKPKLNAWAQQGGEAEKLAVGAAGFLAFYIELGPTLAATLVDRNAIRRMTGQMLGTVLSASMGNQEAQDQLKEMTPFWSWLAIGEKIGDLWTAHDYYGAGKKAGEIILQVVGDLTIVFPVVKGAAIAIQAGEKTTQVLIQALRKTATGFVRDLNPADGLIDASKMIKACKISCFPAGVLVLMADGSKKSIENIEVGESVMADDPYDDEGPYPKKVLGRPEFHVEALLEVCLENGEIVPTTGNHPFWVKDKGWVEAMMLDPGDQLLSADGRVATVANIVQKNTPSSVWNLTVEDSHSFFVLAGNQTILVHNTNPGLRTYVVYEVTLNDGTKYVGRASIAYTRGSAVDEAVERCLDARFKRHHRLDADKGFIRANAKPRWHGIYHTGKTADKLKLYETMRGLEQHYELENAALGKSANRNISGWKAPVAEGNQKYETYKKRAAAHIKTICVGG